MLVGVRMEPTKNPYIRGKTLHSQTREVIANVYNVCDEESINNNFKLPLKRKLERVAMYTGVSVTVVKKIHKEDVERKENIPEKLLSSPGKKRSRPSAVQNIDDFDFSIIRRIIEKFYLELKVVPSLKKLLQKLKSDTNFPFSRETLRRMLKANGFYWRKCQNKRKILVERPNILHWRYKYIHAIRKYREEGRNIIYVDETWVDNDLTVPKCWQSAEVFGVVKNISSTGKLVDCFEVYSLQSLLTAKNILLFYKHNIFGFEIIFVKLYFRSFYRSSCWFQKWFCRKCRISF